MTSPIEYPPEPIVIERLKRFPAIHANWDFSHDVLCKLGESLAKEFDGSPLCIAAAGSLGRLDACSHSDLDYMLLTDVPLSKAEYDSCAERIVRIAGPVRLKPPNKDGVFAEPTEIPKLVSDIGSRADGLRELAHRMLLLMEARPLFNEQLFVQTQNALLEKYFEYLVNNPHKEAVVLLNDVIRYFRSICINYQFTFWNEEEKWALRNIKLRHSRVVMYAGLLFLVLNSSKTQHRRDKLGYIRSNLGLSPIERVAHVYQDNDDYNIDRVLAHWDFFLRRMSDQTARGGLQAIDYEQRYSNETYADLKVNSDGLQSELTRFIWARRNQWSSRVFEYLFF